MAATAAGMLVAKPDITSFAQLKGKKIGVQNGSIGLVSLLWKLKHEGLEGAVDLAYMDNQDQPIPLMRGDVQAICCFEPYATLRGQVNGFGQGAVGPLRHADGQDQPRLRRQPVPFIKKDPALTRTLVQAHVKATNDPARATRPSPSSHHRSSSSTCRQEVADRDDEEPVLQRPRSGASRSRTD